MVRLRQGNGRNKLPQTGQFDAFTASGPRVAAAAVHRAKVLVRVVRRARALRAVRHRKVTLDARRSRVHNHSL